MTGVDLQPDLASDLRLREPSTERAYFRPDINGLRAVAVLGVILFHLSVPEASGGFLGVDVFLTISGYLITGSILRDIRANRFSFVTFYYRRARRLGPALVATVAGSLIVAIVLLPPSYLMQTSKASLAALLSVSNIYFWSEAGYFSDQAITKPLLHTWSLGLEEQFYLIWPMLLVLGSRFRLLAPGLGFILFGGVLVSEIAVRNAPDAAFYLLPFRAFEFAVGALVVFTEKAARQPRAFGEFIALLGLAAIVASLTLFGAKTPFPGINTLIPCLATAALIQIGPTRLSGLVLENPISGSIGRVSYSLYLVHWPIVVFYSFVAFRDLTSAEKASLLGATFGAGYLLYYAVERRFRYCDFAAHRRAVAAGFGATSIIGLVAIAAWGGQGWPWRSSAYLSARFVEDQKDRRFAEISRLCDQRSWTTCWNVVPTDRKKVLILGDSEATDGLNMVTPALGQEYLILSDRPGCPPFTATSTILKGQIPNRAACIAVNKERVNPAYLKKFDLVVVSTLWEWYTPDHLRELLDFIKINAPKVKVIVFGPNVDLMHPCWEYMQRKRTKDCFQPDNIRRWFGFESALKKVATEYGYLYISKHDLLCPDGKNCQLFTDDKARIPMTWDEFHLSYEFALLLGEKAKDQIRRYVFGP